MKLKLLSVIATLSIFGSAAVWAEPKEFKDVDIDADGFLTKAEFSKAEADSDFEEFDENEDGKISKTEYQDKLEECE